MKQRPFSVNEAEYPFKSRWFEKDGVNMHYIDEGEGIPIVMCHGNPTWSYLYRHIIKELSPNFRCIAYDLPGFGFSDHPPGYSYMPQDHAKWIEALVFEHLKLEKCIFIVQDWGGPTGLSVASRYPDRVSGVVISSTFIGKPSRTFKIFSSLMGSRLGQYLIYKKNFFAKTLVPKLLAQKPSQETRDAYTNPFPTPESRKGTAVFPVEIVGSVPWLVEVEASLAALAEKPVEFVFALKDLGTSPADRKKWLAIFPNASVQEVPDAGHYSQEDCPEKFAIAVNRIAEGLA